MAVSVQQTDDAPAFAEGAYCSGLSASANTRVLAAGKVGGTPGAASDSITMNGNQTNVRQYQVEYEVPVGYDGGAGDIAVPLNHDAGAVAVTIVSAYACRVNSSGVNQETLGSATGLSISFSSTGVHTVTINQPNPATFAAGDRIVVVFGMTSGSAMTPYIFGILPNQVVTLPGSVPAAGGQPARTMQQARMRRAA